MSRCVFLTGEHPELGTLYAAVDALAHHTKGRVEPRRFSAFVAPFRSEGDARDALIAAGAKAIEPEAKRVAKRNG